MTITTAQVVPAIIVPLLAWRVYRRLRRTIGRQPFQPKRMTGRIIFFSVLSLVIGAASLQYLPSLAALGGGLLLAVPLALVGLKLTRFEITAEGRFYTPNTAIGIALTALLIGRVTYRIIVLLSASSSSGGPPPAMFQSPVTLLVFGVTAGYYIAYYTGVLWRGRHLKLPA